MRITVVRHPLLWQTKLLLTGTRIGRHIVNAAQRQELVPKVFGLGKTISDRHRKR